MNLSLSAVLICVAEGGTGAKRRRNCALYTFIPLGLEGEGEASEDEEVVHICDAPSINLNYSNIKINK